MLKGLVSASVVVPHVQSVTEHYPDHTGGTPGSSTYGIVSFTPDAAGRLMRRQDQAGDTVTFNYDMAGRILSRAYRTLANSPSGTVADSDTMTYDPASRLLSAVSGRYSNTVTYTYDSAGRTKTEGLAIAGQTYTTTTDYNSRGEQIKLTYPDGAIVERSYTDRGELYQIKHNGTVIDSRAYDDGGRMTGSSYNNSVGETRSYNNDNTLASISFTGASIGNMNYTWDANKNKTGESIAGTMSNYGFTVPTGGYDAEDRLVGYSRTSGLNQSWNLSLVGDWNSVTTNGTAQSRTHGPTHELTVGAGQSVVSDVKGNITTIPAALRPNASSLTMTWDFDNRLSSAAVSGGATVSQQFDALGRRVARTVGSSTTVFVPSGQQTIADYSAGVAPASSTYRYLYASYVDEPVMRWQTAQSQAVYYHRNQQYSVVALTDASGAIVERYAYTAYGQPTFLTGSGTLLPDTAVANRYTYTGREWDGQVQLFHYRARTYDAGLGRFCSRDPIGYTSGYSLYRSYFSVKSVDPSGMCPPCTVDDSHCFEARDNALEMAEAHYQQQLADLEHQGQDFIENLEAAAQWEYDLALQAAEAARDWATNQCESLFDCSGFLCSSGRLACIATANAAYETATGAAYTVNQIALAAIAAEYAAFYAGQRGGIELGKMLADAIAVDAWTACVNQAFIEQCPEDWP